MVLENLLRALHDRSWRKQDYRTRNARPSVPTMCAETSSGSLRMTKGRSVGSPTSLKWLPSTSFRPSRLVVFTHLVLGTHPATPASR